MNIVLISIVIFLLTLAASYAGLQTQKRLADEHKTGESKAVVGQVAGLLTLLLALVLGTLIGVSFAYFSTQKTELEGFAAQVLRLDQALAQYGPETKPLRDKIKAGIQKGYDTFWGGGEGDSNALSVATPLANAQAINDFLATLQPKTDLQKQALATANQYNSMVEQSRLLMSLQVASGPVSWILIAIMVFWTVALFFGIGLFAEPNSLVIAALAFGAASIAFAIFLILELGLPYTGMLKVSPAAAFEQAIPSTWTNTVPAAARKRVSSALRLGPARVKVAKLQRFCMIRHYYHRKIVNNRRPRSSRRPEGSNDDFRRERPTKR